MGLHMVGCCPVSAAVFIQTIPQDKYYNTWIVYRSEKKVNEIRNSYQVPSWRAKSDFVDK